MRLLVATNNKGKLAEYRELLEGLPIEIISPADMRLRLEPEETGSTFEENAAIKARAFADLTGMVTLADDSGLEVDALGGEPGILSARYGGPDRTDAWRYELLLRNIESVPWERRAARFRCVIAVVDPSELDDMTVSNGACEGFIARVPRGDNGFGYDPVFYLPESDRTMAELSPEDKNAISHRARAARAAKTGLAQRYFPGQVSTLDWEPRLPSASEIRIRPMRPGDLFAVSRTCFGGNGNGEKTLREGIELSTRGRGVMLVAESGEEPVAYAGLETQGRIGRVRDLCTTARVAQAGVGVALMRVLMRAARERGLDTLTVHAAGDDPQLAWYRGLSFRPYRKTRLAGEETLFLKKALR